MECMWKRGVHDQPQKQIQGGENVNMTELEMKEKTIPVTIVCPACKGELSYTKTHVRCSTCSAVYPVRDNVVDLLPGSPSLQIPAAKSMEWGWMVKMYETKLWRKSILNTLLFGISFDKEYKTIVKAQNFSGSETILDLGCGPGMYARPLAQTLHNGYVVGLDLSMPMLSYAAWKAQTEGILNLLLIHGSAKDLPFIDSQFDAINCCGALHLFPEPPTMQGIYRVLKPGGCFTVATTRQLIPGPLGKKLYNYLYHHGWPKYFLHTELESLLGQAGFINVRFLHEKRYWHVVSAVKPE